MSQPIKVGTRGSELAMCQTHEIIALMKEHHPALEFEIVEITTHGDRFQEVPIAQMEEHIDRGIFNSALEEAILSGHVDFATCSFKDVESDLPSGIEAVSVGRRVDVRDVLVTRHECGLRELRPGAVLATSSPRRTSQLQAFRPDLRFHPLRGNITTRVDTAAAQFDGIIVAAAGVLRLGLEAKISEWIGTDVLLPAAAQAAMGCEYRSGRDDIAGLIASIQDGDTELCVRAEKQLLTNLSGGCFAPIGVLAKMEGGQFAIHCRIVSLDGRQKAEAESHGNAQDSDAVVAELADNLRGQGGPEIIHATRAALLQN
ncbi:MAG: hydroxymethylbilane synthase [SAR324 cluster bacterium]|nr:hydroxymethylbilane synthase [SAR324 cluster bacterium]